MKRCNSLFRYRLNLLSEIDEILQNNLRILFLNIRILYYEIANNTKSYKNYHILIILSEGELKTTIKSYPIILKNEDIIG